MSASISLEEKFEAVMKNIYAISASNQELNAQNKYLRKQLGDFMKQKQKMYTEPTRTKPTRSEHGEGEQAACNPLSSSSKDEAIRRLRIEPRFQANSNDFRVEILEFEVTLDPDEFFKWMHIGERIFEYKDIHKVKKVTLVAFRQRKYASL